MLIGLITLHVENFQGAEGAKQALSHATLMQLEQPYTSNDIQGIMEGGRLLFFANENMKST